jgi:nitroimidazol reductase NimA-like FMN-containing flavoprotein (pyridoxamine 5'-phosphate oxidase superfamily)
MTSKKASGPRRLSKREISGLLRRGSIASLATVDSTGRPHVIPMWFRHLDGALLFPTSSKTRKIRHLARNPQAAATVHETQGGIGNRGVLLRGRVDLLSGAEAKQLNRSIHLRYVTARQLRNPTLQQYLATDDVTIRMAIEETVSWDFGGLYESA